MEKELSKNEVEILNLFRKNLFIKKTIREISLILKKHYPRTYDSVKNLERKEILKIKKIGNSNVCEINLSQKTISSLSYLDEQEAIDLNIPNLKKVVDFKEFFDDIIIVTGSYAIGKQTKKSDIDLVIITKENAFNKQKLLENLSISFIPEIHPIIFTHKDFVNMLLNNEENFGKEVFNNHLLFRNSARYYLLIKEAIQHGFNN